MVMVRGLRDNSTEQQLTQTTGKNRVTITTDEKYLRLYCVIETASKHTRKQT